MPCVPIATAMVVWPDMLTRTFIIATGLLLMLLAADADAKYRWKDDSGTWIYDDTPPKDPNQPYCKSNELGIWSCQAGAERLLPPPPDPENLSREEQQARYDALLMMRFRSLDAIEEAQELELTYLQYEEDATLSNLELHQNTLFQLIQRAADVQRADREVPSQRLEEIEATQALMLETEGALAEIEARRQDKLQQFSSLKERYQQLLNERSP